MLLYFSSGVPTSGSSLLVHLLTQCKSKIPECKAAHQVRLWSPADERQDVIVQSNWNVVIDNLVSYRMVVSCQC